VAIDFRVAQHSITGRKIVQVLMDSTVVGVIYPTVGGIKIVSAHFSEVNPPSGFEGEILVDDGSESFPPIPHIIVSFAPRQYTIVGNKLVYLE